MAKAMAERCQIIADIPMAFIVGGQGKLEGAVTRDPAAAARWLEPAAERGKAMAQYLLGQMYHEGSGLPKDEAAALKWSLVAAEQGITGAQHEAGVLLGSQKGAWKSWIEAYKWFLIAAREGYPGAKQNLELLAKRLNWKEIEEADKLAEAWKPKS